jgi:hypothetical protein
MIDFTENEVADWTGDVILPGPRLWSWRNAFRRFPLRRRSLAD